jgi:dTDP-glucose 4,6-dehydratase
MSWPYYKPHNILVTGGAGFIGANFIRYLLSEREDVNIINLDLLTYAGSLKNLTDLPDPSRHTFIQEDICDPSVIISILRKYYINTIVHFAAESHVDRSISGPAAFIKTNILGTFTLLEGARQYWLIDKKWGAADCRFHHISTDEVYGSLNLNDLAFTEQTRYAPNSPYSASKAGSDHLVRAYIHTYQLPATLSNCSNNYGPYQHAEKLIPTIIRSCQQWNPIPIYGDGSNIRDWLYVEDHCAALLTILERGKSAEVYNIGANNELSNLTVAQTICDLMDAFTPKPESHHSLIQFVKDRPGHDWRYAINSTKLTRELDWKPQETFKTGLQKTLEFYVQLSKSKQ